MYCVLQEDFYMNYRFGIDALYERFGIWNGYLTGKVRLIGCGGTALTLLGFKETTKDVDCDNTRRTRIRFFCKDIATARIQTSGRA